MSDTIHRRIRQTTAALVALAVALSVFGPVGTVAANPSVGVTLQADSTTITPGETVTITTTMSAEEVNGPLLQHDLPDGWTGTVVDAAGGTAAPLDDSFEPIPSNEPEVVWTAPGTYEVQVEVQVPSDAASGEYTIAADGSGLTPDGTEFADSDSLGITVADEQANAAPTADAGSDQTVDEGTEVTLDAADSDDPDGDTLSYAWSVADAAGTGVTLADADTATPTFTAPGVDSETTLEFEVSVADGNGGTDTDAVTVTVQPGNEPPTASISGPSSAQTGESVSFDASASDDGTVDSYAWAFGDGDTASGQSVSHTFDSAGDYTVELTVTDDDGATATATQTVSVSAAAQPAAFEITDLSAPSAATQGDTITVDATVENTGDVTAEQSVAFSFDGTQLGSQNVTLAGGQSETVSFTVDTSGIAPGTYTHGVSTDDDTATATITIDNATTQPDPDGISVTLDPVEQTAVTGETVTYDVVVNGADDVGSFDGSIALSNGDNATITNVTTPAADSNGAITVDGQSADIEVFGLPSDANEPVTVATVTVSADAVGEADLSLSVDFLSDQQGDGYTVDSTDGATLTVGLEPVTGTESPTNLDDDPVLEDVNGDGVYNVGDAQALFNNQDSQVVQNNVEQFDFNGDGEINVGDAQAAFYEAVDAES